MASKRKPGRPGTNIPEAARGTAKLSARVPVELYRDVHHDAETYDLTLAEVLAAYRDLAAGSGRLGKVLHAAMVKAEHPEDYARAVRGEAPVQEVVIKGKATTEPVRAVVIRGKAPTFTIEE
jgi:hypothetical protein